MEKQEKGKVRQRPWKSSLLVILIFLALWLVGVNSGEAELVLEDALQICFSCIGIG